MYGVCTHHKLAASVRNNVTWNRFQMFVWCLKLWLNAANPNEWNKEEEVEEHRIATVWNGNEKQRKTKINTRSTKRKCLFCDSHIVWLIISYYMMFDPMELAHCLHVKITPKTKYTHTILRYTRLIVRGRYLDRSVGSFFLRRECAAIKFVNNYSERAKVRTEHNCHFFIFCSKRMTLDNHLKRVSWMESGDLAYFSSAISTANRSNILEFVWKIDSIAAITFNHWHNHFA